MVLSVDLFSASDIETLSWQVRFTFSLVSCFCTCSRSQGLFFVCPALFSISRGYLPLGSESRKTPSVADEPRASGHIQLRYMPRASFTWATWSWRCGPFLWVLWTSLVHCNQALASTRCCLDGCGCGPLHAPMLQSVTWETIGARWRDMRRVSGYRVEASFSGD